MTLAAFQSLVDDLVRDTDQVISAPARDTAIANAVAQYSADAPRRVVVDAAVDSDGNLPLPADWTDDVSKLLDAEYPIGQRPPVFIPDELITPYASPTGTVLMLLGDLAAGETVRMTFTAPHLLDGAHDTLPPTHRRAVASLAAAELCGQLAAQYSNEGAPTIGADIVDHKGKSDRWRARARDLLADYQRIVGSAPSNRTKPASVDVAVERTDSLGRPRLFHPPRGLPR